MIIKGGTSGLKINGAVRMLRSSNKIRDLKPILGASPLKNKSWL